MPQKDEAFERNETGLLYAIERGCWGMNIQGKAGLGRILPGIFVQRCNAFDSVVLQIGGEAVMSNVRTSASRFVSRIQHSRSVPTFGGRDARVRI